MKLEAGDVVQLDPKLDNFGGCFMVVTEPKPWGAQGYVDVPGVDGTAYYRAKTEDMVYIGKAAWSRTDSGVT